MVLKEPGSHKFTLVVSQYEKHLTIHYSLRVYATCPFTLQKIKNYCKHKQEVRIFSLFLKYSKNIWSDSHVLFRKSNPELKGRKFDDYLCVDMSSKLLLSDSHFLSLFNQMTEVKALIFVEAFMKGQSRCPIRAV